MNWLQFVVVFARCCVSYGWCSSSSICTSSCCSSKTSQNSKHKIILSQADCVKRLSSRWLEVCWGRSPRIMIGSHRYFTRCFGGCSSSRSAYGMIKLHYYRSLLHPCVCGGVDSPDRWLLCLLSFCAPVMHPVVVTAYCTSFETSIVLPIGIFQFIVSTCFLVQWLLVVHFYAATRTFLKTHCNSNTS